jgi:hypothetical protein
MQGNTLNFDKRNESTRQESREAPTKDLALLLVPTTTAVAHQNELESIGGYFFTPKSIFLYRKDIKDLLDMFLDSLL